MNQENGNDSSDSKDMIYLMGGLALMVLGAGLIMTNKTVRSTILTGVSAIVPQLRGKYGFDISHVSEDLQRYVKLKSM